MNRSGLAIVWTLSLGLAAACSSGEGSAPAPAAQTGAVKVGLHPRHRPHPYVLAKGKSPQPPAGTWQSNSIGERELAVKTGNASGDTDAVWAEDIDSDSDGQPEQTDLLYDDEDKVLYLFAEQTFSCTDGRSQGSGGMLMAVYGKGDPLGAPAGSGWYLVEIHAGDCNAQAETLWGCRFDASGNRTECGPAEVRSEEDDITFTDGRESQDTLAIQRTAPHS